MTGLYLVALTGPERDAAMMALHARQGQLDAVKQLAFAGSGAEASAQASKLLAAAAWEKLRAADETGVECEHCGRAVPPDPAAVPYCSEACWSAAVAKT